MPSGTATAGAGVAGTSTVPGGAGVRGECAGGAGVWGTSDVGVGLLGHSKTGAAAQLESTRGVALVAFGHTSNGNTIHAINDSTEPVTRADRQPSGAAVFGETSVRGRAAVHGLQHEASGSGVLGQGGTAGVSGYHRDQSGVFGASVAGNGIHGIAEGPGPFAELLERGELTVETKERLAADHGRELRRVEHGQLIRISDDAIERIDPEPPGWVAVDDELGLEVAVDSPWVRDHVPELTRPTGPRGNGVWGHTRAPHGNGVLGTVAAGTEGAAAVSGVGALAGRFVGAVDVVGAMHVAGTLGVDRTVSAARVNVSGDIEVGGDVRLLGADLAEGFEVHDRAVAPGSVLVLDDDGRLRLSTSGYDARVAGVVSGAGDFRPGVLLDQADADAKLPVALVGKVCCWVDAERAPVRVGDLLTTADVPGHAMRVEDRERAFGAVLGKAMQPLAGGRGLIRVLVALQ